MEISGEHFAPRLFPCILDYFRPIAGVVLWGGERTFSGPRTRRSLRTRLAKLIERAS